MDERRGSLTLAPPENFYFRPLRKRDIVPPLPRPAKAGWHDPHDAGSTTAIMPRATGMIRTFVAEPTALTRAGLVALLSGEEDIELVAAVESAEEAVPIARELRPDVALLADASPDQDGLLIASTLHAAMPSCRCLILSHNSDPQHLERAVAARVDGYLHDDCPAEFLSAAIRQIAAGYKVIDPRIAFSVVRPRVSPLTLRETEALRAAAQGFTTAEIAAELYLAVGSVRNYLSRASVKLGARNRVDAIRIATESGWL